MSNATDNHFIEVEPLGVSFEAHHGETVMAAAIRNGIGWPTVCRGNAQCGACYVEILGSAETLAAPEARETRTLRMVPKAVLDRAEVRLACQLRVMGGLHVRRAGVRAPTGGIGTISRSSSNPGSK